MNVLQIEPTRLDKKLWDPTTEGEREQGVLTHDRRLVSVKLQYVLFTWVMEGTKKEGTYERHPAPSNFSSSFLENDYVKCS